MAATAARPSALTASTCSARGKSHGSNVATGADIPQVCLPVVGKSECHTALGT